MNVLVFGGSFNPIHLAHIELVKGAKKALSPEKIILIPTFLPPHKGNEEMVSAFHRVNMCKLAAKEIGENTEVNDIEIKREGLSYTKDTLYELKKNNPEYNIDFLMGEDMYITLKNWKAPETIFSLCRIVAALRSEDGKKRMQEYEKEIRKMGAITKFIDVPYRDISSTEVRQLIKKREKCFALNSRKCKRIYKGRRTLYLRSLKWY